jgi:hypothetical protein
MKRRGFLKAGCLGGILAMAGEPKSVAQDVNTPQPEEAKKNIFEMNQEQVKKVIKYIDNSQEEAVKKSIFGQLGRQCFYCREVDRWINSFKGDVEAFLDRVNTGKSKSWERLEFNEEKTILTLTGRPGGGCVCAFADITKPPKSLCYYCCKSFREELFGKLLKKKVEVEITQTRLLGNDRCNSLIHIYK